MSFNTKFLDACVKFEYNKAEVRRLELSDIRRDRYLKFVAFDAKLMSSDLHRFGNLDAIIVYFSYRIKDYMSTHGFEEEMKSLYYQSAIRNHKLVKNRPWPLADKGGHCIGSRLPTC